MWSFVWLHGMVNPIASNFFIAENVMYLCCISHNYCNMVECSHNFSTYYNFGEHILTYKIGVGLSWSAKSHRVPRVHELHKSSRSRKNRNPEGELIFSGKRYLKVRSTLKISGNYMDYKENYDNISEIMEF